MTAAGMPRCTGEQRRRPRRRTVLVMLRRQRRRAVRRQDWTAVARLDTEYWRHAQRERRYRRQVKGGRLVRLLHEDPAAFFKRFRGPTR